MGSPDLTAQIGLVCSTGIYSDGIRFFQSLREPAHLAKYTHCVTALDNDRLLEAMPGGARITRIDTYDRPIVWSQFIYKGDERDSIVNWTEDREGAPYAWEDIPLIALALTTGDDTPQWLEDKLAADHRYICSELADAAYKQAGLHLFKNIPPSAVYPAMIAALFDDYGWLPTEH
jgi:uncharacterized protein YycO